MTSGRPRPRLEPMAIFKDSETPRMVAVSISHHHRDASFRLDLVGVLLDELDADMAALGFPNARKVLALGRAAVADATTVARALDVAIARREAAAEIRSAAKVAPEVSLAQARAEYTAPEDPADDRVESSRSQQALGALEDAAAELDAEESP